MSRILVFTLGAVAVISGVLAGQQRQPLQLPAPSQARPNPGQNVPRPEGALPTVPAGFVVDVYYDNIQGPRFMEWAPNGDLFVTQTQQNAVRGMNSHGLPAPSATRKP